MTEKLKSWDRLPTETSKSYAAFLAYVALGARRSVSEAARKHHGQATEAGEIHGLEKTTQRTWEGWSSRHNWVSRANARDVWLANVSDEQIMANLKACMLAMTTRAHDFLKAKDAADFLRAARALALHFPPVQRMADVSEPTIASLSDLTDEQLARMEAVRDEARAENARKDKV